MPRPLPEDDSIEMALAAMDRGAGSPYDVPSEFEDDEEMMDLLRRGYRAPEPQRFQPQRRPDARFGPVRFSGESIDSLLESLQQSTRDFRPRNFGEGLARGVVRGLTAGPLRETREREKRNAADELLAERRRLREEMDSEKARDAATTLAGQRRAVRAKRSNEMLLPVSARMARALGRDDLIGKSVPESEWDILAKRANQALDLEPKPVPAPKPDQWEGLSARDRWEMEKFDKRESQITARIDRWKQSRQDTKAERDTAAAEIARLEADLDKLYADRDAKMGAAGSGGDASGSGTAAPAPSAARTAARVTAGRGDSATVAGRGAQRGKEGEAAKLSGQLKTARERLSARLKAVRAAGGDEAVTDIPALRKQVADLGQRLSGLGYSLNEGVEGVEAVAAPNGAAGGATQRALSAAKADGITPQALDRWLNVKGPDGTTRRQAFEARGVDLGALRSGL